MGPIRPKGSTGTRQSRARAALVDGAMPGGSVRYRRAARKALPELNKSRHDPSSRRRRTAARTLSGSAPATRFRSKPGVPGKRVHPPSQAGRWIGQSSTKTSPWHAHRIVAWPATDCGSSCPRSCAGEAGLTRPSHYSCSQDCASTIAILQNRSLTRNPARQMPRQRLRSFPLDSFRSSSAPEVFFGTNTQTKHLSILGELTTRRSIALRR